MYKKAFFILWCVLAAVAAAGPSWSAAVPGDDESALAAVRDLGLALVIEKPQAYKELTIYPITVEKVKDPERYTCLDEALSKRWLTISEMKQAQVPRLKLVKKGNGRIFIMTGEIVTGAKQDRMSSHDVLIGPGAGKIALPVYCVEHGRWTANSPQFGAGGTAGTKKLRKSAAAKNTQGKIWSDVAEKNRQAGTDTDTGTMQAAYDNPRIKERLDAYRAALGDLPSRVPGMVGFVMVSGGTVATADVFANPDLLKDLWPKLLAAAALDALTAEGKTGPETGLDQVRDFIGAGLAGSFEPVDNPGLGHEFLIGAGSGISGTALVHDGSVVHLALFSEERNGPRELASGANEPLQQLNEPEEIKNRMERKILRLNEELKIKTYREKGSVK